MLVQCGLSGCHLGLEGLELLIYGQQLLVELGGHATQHIACSAVLLTGYVWAVWTVHVRLILEIE